MKKLLYRTSFLLALGVLVTASLSVLTAQQQAPRTPKNMPFPKSPDWSKLEVDVLKVQGQVSLIAGAGGNIAVQTGDESILMVDTGYEQMSAKVLAAIRKLSNKPLRTIISTTLMDSHTGANGILTKAGFQIDNTGPGLGAT